MSQACSMDQAARLVEVARRRGRRLTIARALDGVQAGRTLATKWGEAWWNHLDRFNSDEQRLAWISLRAYGPATNHECRRWLVELHRLGLLQPQSANRRCYGAAEGAPYGDVDRSEKNYILANGY